MKGNPRYIPALQYHFLTRLYDPLVRLVMPMARIWNTLVQNSEIGDVDCVLDIGCGPGGLIMAVKDYRPFTIVVGCDVDRTILQIARRKTTKADVSVDLYQSHGNCLPHSDESVDRILTSLVLHHLDADVKFDTLAEAHRVLVSGGTISVADFKRSNPALEEELASAGFGDVQEFGSVKTVFGVVGMWKGRRGRI
jgi:ubiquinone/menaquinone biosynthesis C-methylase UbiE